MSETHKHEKVVSTTRLDHETIEVVTNSYYEHLAHHSEETEKTFMRPRQSLLKDVMDSIDPFTKGSPKVVISLEAKPRGMVKIVRRVTRVREAFGKE